MLSYFEILKFLEESNLYTFTTNKPFTAMFTNQIKSVYWLIIVTVTTFTKRARKYYINNNIKHSYY